MYKNSNSKDSEPKHAFFAADIEGFSPEFFSRQGREIWFGGLNSSTLPIPELASDVQPIPEAIDSLKKAATQIVCEEGLSVVRESLAGVSYHANRPMANGLCSAFVQSRQREARSLDSYRMSSWAKISLTTREVLVYISLLVMVLGGSRILLGLDW